MNKTVKLSTRAGFREWEDAIVYVAMEPEKRVESHGALRVENGYCGGDWCGIGQNLIKAERDGTLRAVVYSYSEPIAWVVMNDDHELMAEVTTRKWSVTTTRHTNLIATALQDYLVRPVCDDDEDGWHRVAVLDRILGREVTQ